MADASLAIAAARRYFTTGDYDRCEQLCLHLQDGPSHGDAAFLLGRMASQAGRPVEAEAQYRAALVALDTADGRNNLGNALAAQRRFAEAEAEYRRAIELAPDYAEAHNNLGNALRELGRWEESEQAFDAALAQRHSYAEAHNNLGLTLRRQDRLDDAEHCFRVALRYRRDYPEAHNNLGIALAAGGNLAGAVQQFEHALRLRCDYANAQRNLGMALAESGRHEGALAVYEQQLAADPADADAHWRIARILRELGRGDEAHAELLRAMTLAPQRDELHVDAAHSWLDRGRPESALRHAQRCVNNPTTQARSLLLQGRALAAMDRWDEAAPVAAALLAIAPQDPDALRLAGQADCHAGSYAAGFARLAESDQRERPRAGVLESGATPPTIELNLCGMELTDVCWLAWLGAAAAKRGMELAAACNEQARAVLSRAPGWATLADSPVADSPVERPRADLSPWELAAHWTNAASAEANDAPQPQASAAPAATEPGERSLRVGFACSSGAPDAELSEWKRSPVLWLTAAAMHGIQATLLTDGSGDGLLRVLEMPTLAARDNLHDFCDELRSLDLVVGCDGLATHLAAALGVETWLVASQRSDWRRSSRESPDPWRRHVRAFHARQGEDSEALVARVQVALVERLKRREARQPPRFDLVALAKSTGRWLLNEKRPHEARVCLQVAAELGPDDRHAELQLAEALLRSGRDEDAVERLTRLVGDDLTCSESRRLLSEALARRGCRDEAIAQLQAAHKLDPDNSVICYALGAALLAADRNRDAARTLSRAAELDPERAAHHAASGDALRRCDDKAEAVAAYRRATQCDDALAEHWNALGGLLRDQDGAAASVDALQQALRQFPDSPDLHSNLGISLARMEQYEAALSSYKTALRYRPAFADAYNNQGIALARLARREESAASYRRALQLRRDYPEAHNNLGIILTELGDCDQALAHYAEALRLKPDYPAAHSNRGITLTEQGQLDEAERSYAAALAIDPKYADGRMNRSLVRLSRGEFDSGWADYEYRWRCGDARMPAFTQPLWSGEPLTGQRIVLHAEQGLGDTLQFVRLAAMVKQRGTHVTVMCQRALMPVLQRTPGIDRLVPKIMEGDLPECDYHIPLLSLPRVLGLNAENVPRDVPYVLPAEELVESWQARLDRSASLRVGISWQGNRHYRGDRQRSIPLAHFGPLAAVPGVRLYGLQKNFGREQLVDLAADLAITDLGPQLDEQTGPFMDTAALAAALDLVVTSDTAVAHLCGAVGAQVWLALPYSADWRWLRDTNRSPWYPTMRLFRQPARGDWTTVFATMAEELANFAASRAAAPPLLAPVAPGELFDKITILQLKADRIDEPQQKAHVEFELNALCQLRPQSNPAALDQLVNDLAQVNSELWEIEDDIRDCEGAGDFGPRFVELARSVYQTNDRRAAIKREINDLLGATIREVKSYRDYGRAPAACSLRPTAQPRKSMS